MTSNLSDDLKQLRQQFYDYGAAVATVEAAKQKRETARALVVGNVERIARAGGLLGEDAGLLAWWLVNESDLSREEIAELPGGDKVYGAGA